MFNRKEDVIYGRKDGMALTLDVFMPSQKTNGLGLILVLSNGWTSGRDIPNYWMKLFVDPPKERGYTIFAVAHGSQPKYTIPENILDVKRAVRFIRHHAADYGIDPNRLGIYGGSAGGQLSLMIGLTGADGDAKSADAVEREPSRVAAVGEFYGPTDFLNYGRTGKDVLQGGRLAGLKAPFDFTEFDAETQSFYAITDLERIREIGREISPINYVHADAPPTMIIHGDADTAVPLQQSQIMARALDKAGVKNKLIVVPGSGHGWDDMSGEMAQILDWFDVHLSQPQVV